MRRRDRGRPSGEDLAALTGETVLRLPARRVYLPQRRRGLPPVGAPAALRSPGHVHRAGAAGRGHCGCPPPADPPENTAVPGGTDPARGEVHDLPELAERLAAAGYARCEQVEGAGQFALRGGILDFFSLLTTGLFDANFWR
ncbi:MAG: hypothetical protein ACLSAF_05300 [Intestinimonas sp.]